MKKKAMISCALILSGFFLAGVIAQGMPALKVSAYLAHRNEKENVVKIGDNTSEIVEEFDPPDEIHPDTPYAKTVMVQNKTDTACYVRYLWRKTGQISLLRSISIRSTGLENRRMVTIITGLCWKVTKRPNPLFTTVTTAKLRRHFEFWSTRRPYRRKGMRLRRKHLPRSG